MSSPARAGERRDTASCSPKHGAQVVARWAATDRTGAAPARPEVVDEIVAAEARRGPTQTKSRLGRSKPWGSGDEVFAGRLVVNKPGSCGTHAGHHGEERGTVVRAPSKGPSSRPPAAAYWRTGQAGETNDARIINTKSV